LGYYLGILCYGKFWLNGGWESIKSVI
jgi:hypothetical protein